jgi:hypothetical protein
LILDETAYRVERYARQVEEALSSGDEVAVLAFIRQHVEPLFEQLAELGPEVRERIGEYRITLDPDLGTVYRRRREYEDSVTLISDTISAYLDAEEELAQSMFPHYSSGSGPMGWTIRSTSAGAWSRMGGSTSCTCGTCVSGS